MICKGWNSRGEMSKNIDSINMHKHPALTRGRLNQRGMQ
jgi:hypothetical protein